MVAKPTRKPKKQSRRRTAKPVNAMLTGCLQRPHADAALAATSNAVFERRRGQIPITQH
jgi:hypothetical protein